MPQVSDRGGVPEGTQGVSRAVGCAVVLVRHLTRRGGRHALYRGGGSTGIVAATRSALMVGRPPDDPNLRVLRQTRSNPAPLAFRYCSSPWRPRKLLCGSNGGASATPHRMTC